MNKLFAGVGQADITPPEGVRLAGYPHFPRENTGFHDPLFATAIYISDGDTEFAFVTLDILFFSKKYAAESRKRICAECGIPERNILLCCSHTHSGPWAAGNPELEATAGDSADIDPEYLGALLDKIAALVVGAKTDRFPAAIGFGSGICGAESGVGGNRRDKNGIADPTVNIMAVKDAETGAIRGIIANYALHPTFLHEDSTLVSADYPGYLRDTLGSYYPSAVVGFAQGASGDQSSRYFRHGQSFDEAKRVGSLMGEAARGVIEKIDFEREARLAHEYIELPLEIREYAPIPELEEKVKRRTAEYEKLKAEGASYLDVQNANLRMLGAEDMLGYALCVKTGKRIDLRDDENPAEVSAFRIGKHIIAGYPGEVFVEYALKLKKASPAESTFVFELADGCLPGYCINSDAIAEEGYEAGNSMLAPGFGDKIAGAALDLINKIWD